MTAQTLSSSHAGSDVAAQLAAFRQQQLSAFDDRSLAWLALTPAWTERLARAARFPTGDRSLPQFLDEMEQQHLAQRGPSVTAKDLVLRRTRAVLIFWPYLDADQRRRLSPVLQQGLVAITDRTERLRIQIALVTLDTSAAADGAPTPLLQELLAAIDAQPARLRVLLIGQLVSVARSPAVLDKALVIIRGISDPETGCRLLATVLAAFPERTDLVELGRSLATAINDPETRAHTLLILAAPLRGSGPASALEAQALDSIGQIASAQEQAGALAAALPRLAPPALESAVASMMTSIPSIANPVYCAQILVALGPHVGPDRAAAFTGMLVETTRRAGEIRDSGERDNALAMIAVAHGQIGDPAAAQEVTQAIKAQVKRSITLLEIAAVLPSDSGAAMTASIAGSWQGLSGPVLETLYLGIPKRCARYLPRTLVNNIAHTIDTMVGDRRFEPAIRLLDLLATRAPVLQRILSAVLAIGNESERNAALVQLAPRIPAPARLQAVSMLVEEAPPDRPFWMPDVSRQDVIRYLRQRPRTDLLQSATSNAGQAVLRAIEEEGLDVAPATFRWAQIAARCSNLATAADFVNEKVYAAVEIGDLGDALEYAKATTELASSLGQQLELAVAQVQHRIGLAYRRAADERHLIRFLPRKEHSEAIASLLADSTPYWATHFLGAGGVGKTMLMRELTARLAVKNGRRLPTSRVDFDHINPEFPVRRPGELLAVLSEELRSYGGADQEDRYRRFQGDLTEFHGALNAEPPSEDPLKNIDAPAFERLLHSFAALLHGLPKPVILILDTCEELAKLDPIGSSLPSVEATFRIIERVHALEPGIRVVFAGRRLLARSGAVLPRDGSTDEKKYDWTVRDSALAERNRFLPAAKDYLQLHVMRGFSVNDADDYFSHIVGINLQPAQRAAILDRSRDPGVPFEIDRPRTASAADTGDRYNPFDLSLYADWVKEDPSVSAEVLGSGETDPYVEMRIMRRIAGDALRQAIAYAVLLRRFDVEMLRPAAIAVGYDPARLFRDLGAEEWMEYQQDALQVDTKFLPRLQRYFEHAVRRHLLARATAQLAPELGALVRKYITAKDPFALLRSWHIDAALRLADEADAAELWRLIDRAITDSGNWNWADTVCRVLLNPGNAAGDERSWLHAAVRVTHNAALVHTQPGNQAVIREAWNGIAELSRRHPIETVGAFIAMRSRLWTEALTQAHVLEVLQFGGDDWQREQLAAALAAAMERELEKPDPAVIDVAVKNSTLEPFSPDVQASLVCSLARCSRKRGRAQTAERLALRTGSRNLVQRWADWRRPAALADRIRLELLRLDPSSVDRIKLETWGRKADIDTIDGERLLSRTLALRLEYEPVAPPRLEPGQVYDPRRRPECSAHLETPPLIGPFVDAALSQSLETQNLELVSDVRSRALENQDAAAVQAADAIKLKVDRRLRTADAMKALVDLAATQRPNSSPFHQRWAVHVPGDASGMQVDKRPDGALSGEPADLHALLDLYEGELLGKADDDDRTRLAREIDKARVGLLISGQTVEPRIEYRIAALIGERQPDLSASDRKKPRRLAEIALEEGELLALRLPDRAVWLFEESHRQFTRANDTLGQSLAAISAAMACCRAGDRPRAAAWLERAGEEYQVRSPPQGRPVNAWVSRGAACAAWIGRRDENDPLSIWVRTELSDRYGTAIPPELAFASVPATASERSWSTRLGYIVGFGVGVSSAVAALGLFGWLALKAWDIVRANAEVSMAGGVIVLELIALWLIWWAFRARLARFDNVLQRKSIAIARSPGETKVVLAMDLVLAPPLAPDPSRPLSLLRLMLKPLYLATALPPLRIEQPHFGPHASASSVLPRRFTRQLQAIWSDRVFTLAVDPSLTQFAWEAVLAWRIPRGLGRLLGISTQFVRSASMLSRVPEGIASWGSAAIEVVSRAGLGTRAWGSTKHVEVRGVETLKAARTAANQQASPDTALRVLHLIGRARRGTSGPIFSIGGQGADLGELVSIDRLPLSGTAVVVVQEEPAERLRRLDVDREQAADARDWAGQVFRAGGHTVIFVPAMPLALVESVIGAIAAALDAAQAPDVWRIIAAVEAARRAVIRFKRESAAARSLAPGARDDGAFADHLRELALEITLFTRSEELHLSDSDREIGFAMAKGTGR